MFASFFIYLLDFDWIVCRQSWSLAFVFLYCLLTSTRVLLRFLIVFLGHDGSNRSDMSALPLPSERYPRRASDGCASIGYMVLERDGEHQVVASGTTTSASQIKAIHQEYQALVSYFFIGIDKR